MRTNRLWPVVFVALSAFPLAAAAITRAEFSRQIQTVLKEAKPEYLAGGIGFFLLVTFFSYYRGGSLLVTIGSALLVLVGLAALAASLILGDYFGKFTGGRRRRAEAPPVVQTLPAEALCVAAPAILRSTS